MLLETDRGQVILVLKRCGDTYRDADAPQVDFVHDVRGSVFVVEVRCKSCGQPFRSGELTLDHPAVDC